MNALLSPMNVCFVGDTAPPFDRLAFVGEGTGDILGRERSSVDISRPLVLE